MDEGKTRITVSTGGKRYIRSEQWAEGDGQLMLSETVDIPDNLSPQEVTRIRFDILKKLEFQLLLGFYVKKLIGAKKYKEEREILEKRFNEMEFTLIEQGEMSSGKSKEMPSMYQS